MLEGIKIKCWDAEGESSLILDLEEDKAEPRVLHFNVAMLDAQKVISVYLPDLERAIRQLKLE